MIRWMFCALMLTLPTRAHAQIIPLATIEVAGGLGNHNAYDGHGENVVVCYGEADGMLRLADHAGLIGAVRYQTWRRQGVPYWYAPVTLGIQFF